MLPSSMTRLVPIALLLTVSCGRQTESVVEPAGPIDTVAFRADGWLRGDLHFHTNYSGDAADQGGDDMPGALAVADAWRDSVWVDAHPDRAQDYLDYIAITDHRTTAGHSDPAFPHDHLIVIGGEEFGSDGHAGIWGYQDHIPHEVQADESPNQRIQDAIDEAHAAGALFSINHPMYAGDLWGWDVTGFDAIEIWNGTWSTLAEPSAMSDLDDWVASNGVENPAIRAAVGAAGGGKNAQGLRFWQAWLSLGGHVPPVGGGDRHMLLPAGLPTTWTRAESTDEQGVLHGIASGETFVSRSPQGPQIVLTATVDGVSHPMGAALPGATSVDIHWEVARASGGQLRIVVGEVDPSVPEPRILETILLTWDVQRGVVQWNPPASGGWLHAVVVEPLITEVPDHARLLYEGLTAFPEDGGVAATLSAVGPLLDLTMLSNPERCDPTDWGDEWSAPCMPADPVPLGSVYLTEPIQRLMSTEFEEEQLTGWTMGAISAAFHTAPVAP